MSAGNIVGLVIVVVTMALCLMVVCLRLVYYVLPRSTWFCRELGWHNGDSGEKWHDGCSRHATCSRCGAEVMMDSQGNWF